MRPRLLLLDIDGTLIGRNHTTPSDRVRRALDAAMAIGVRVALCTGRPWTSLLKIAKPLDLAGPHIAFDGALVMANGEEPIYRMPIASTAARALVDATRALGVTVELYLADAHYIDQENAESTKHASLINVEPVVESLDAVLARASEGAIIKGQVIGTGESGRERIHRLEDLGLPLRFGWAKPPPGFGDVDYVNVTHPRVSKGAALAELCRALNVPVAETFAAGDGANDIPLLEAAGYAVAMGNAVESLKSVADVVAPSVDDDGLAWAIERYVL